MIFLFLMPKYNIIYIKTQKKTSDKMIQTQGHKQKLSADLLEQIRQHDQKYRAISQVAYYSSLQPIEQLAIFTKSSCDVQCNVIFCYHAQKYQADKKQQITYYIIRTLNEEIPKLKNKYSIAYVHDSVSNFLYFRNVIRLLPAQHLLKMKDFYIVHAGLAVRFIQMLSFGQINNYIKSKTTHLQRVDQIQTRNKITLGGDVVSKSKMKKLQQDHIRQSQRNTLTITKQMQSSDMKIIRNKLYGKQLIQYQLSQDGIPRIITHLITRLYSNQYFLKAQGIMRKSCDVQQLEILEQHIMQDIKWQQFIYGHQDPYVLCGCVKKIFNNLNSPLFSYEIYDMIMSYRSDGHLENDIKFLRTCVGKMNKINRLVLFYTIAFLKKGVIMYQEDNKMSAYNLAVVFGPCFFRPKQYRLQDLMSSGKFSFIIKLLLENFQDTAGESTAVEMYNLLEKQKLEYKSH